VSILFYDALNSNLFPQKARIAFYSFSLLAYSYMIFLEIYFPNAPHYILQIGKQYDYYSKTVDLSEMLFSAKVAMWLFFFKYLISAIFYPKNFVTYNASLYRD
jgi:hypothetical protein